MVIFISLNREHYKKYRYKYVPVISYSFSALGIINAVTFAIAIRKLFLWNILQIYFVIPCFGWCSSLQVIGYVKSYQWLTANCLWPISLITRCRWDGTDGNKCNIVGIYFYYSFICYSSSCNIFYSK